jgi:putative ABC transport system ATP-binding protein
MKIAINDLTYAYPQGDFTLHLPAMQWPNGSRIALVGPSGSGKTTLLHLLSGITLAGQGSVLLDDVDLVALSDAKRRALRIQSMGFVFQEFRLLEYLSVQENIRLPYRLHGSLDWNAAAVKRRLELMERAGISALCSRKVGRLSTGERQRVAVCRALIASPTLILADEPTANLDNDNKKRVQSLLFEEAQRCGATLVLATHDCELLDAFDTVYHIGDKWKGDNP